MHTLTWKILDRIVLSGDDQVILDSTITAWLRDASQKFKKSWRVGLDDSEVDEFLGLKKCKGGKVRQEAVTSRITVALISYGDQLLGGASSRSIYLL